MRLELFCLSAITLLVFNGTGYASPTVRGLSAQDPSEETDIYTDTGNPSLLYVTPPKQGTISVTRNSLAVDEATCRTVASMNEIRSSEQATKEALKRQEAAIEQYRASILESLMKEGKTATEMAQELAAFDAPMADIKERLRELDTQIQASAVPSYLLESAGYYAFVATAPWAVAISEIQAANPAVVVNRIPTENAKVFVSVLEADGFQPNELIAAVNAGNISDVASVVEGIQIDVEPTKIGACFIKFPHILNAEVDAYPFGITMNYTHKIAVTTTVRASYNLRDVYTYLEKTGRRGGLFSTKSWSEVIEDRQIDEVFNLKIEFEQDVGPEAEEVERKRVREYMLGHAVADMTGRLVPAGDPGQSGAAVAAETLAKTCGFNAYCAGVAAGLTILDGIFGRSGSSSSLTQALDVIRTYDSTVTEAVEIPGTISFTGVF
ncbi:hypothetical protein [Sinorhizobium meliloti]|uniref:hypothetical protein n=1 Tax=Rhizobium meliloti TaxID=382 RepID=UPI0018E76051|nr:hypothetical protein [Sinorhizobium meliloti]QQF06236.1 hypothetical protein JFX10_24820 [Sinorhizobium meliloti]